MFNIGSGELLVILVVALLFLGPNKLPGAARQIGQTVSGLRDLASNFQRELESATNLPTPDSPEEIEARKRGDALVEAERQEKAAEAASTPEAGAADGSDSAAVDATQVDAAQVDAAEIDAAEVDAPSVADAAGEQLATPVEPVPDDGRPVPPASSWATKKDPPKSSKPISTGGPDVGAAAPVVDGQTPETSA